MSDVTRALESRRSRLGRWAGAAAVVCALHAGGAALALMYWHEAEDGDEPAGALTLQMAPLPAAAPVDSPDVAHGPELRQRAEPATEASKDVVEEKDIALVPPSPAPEPEVALPKPQPEEKEMPKEEPRDAALEQPKPRDEADPLTTAPPRVEAPPTASAAPGAGLSASRARAHRRWAKGLVDRIQRFKDYPAEAERRGIKGVTVVRFTVDRSGRVVASEVLKSSGSPILDEEALALLQRASPFPLPPDAVPDVLLQNDLPISFEMKPGR